MVKVRMETLLVGCMIGLALNIMSSVFSSGNDTANTTNGSMHAKLLVAKGEAQRWQDAYETLLARAAQDGSSCPPCPVCRPTIVRTGDSSTFEHYLPDHKVIKEAIAIENVVPPQNSLGMIAADCLPPHANKLSVHFMWDSTYNKQILGIYSPLIGPIKWECLPDDVKYHFTLGDSYKMIRDWWKHPPNLGKTVDKNDPVIFERKVFDKYIAKAKARDYTDIGYHECGKVIYPAFEKYPVAGKRALVVGSREPWVESILFAFGASHVTTSEYFFIKSEYGPQHTTIHVKDLELVDTSKPENQYDAIVSYSCSEHDGLGRYGDPLSPHGDLQSINKLLRHTKPGGRLYIGLPTSFKEGIAWNAHRYYGKLRYPLLTSGWKFLESFPHGTNFADHYGARGGQPFAVFEKPKN